MIAAGRRAQPRFADHGAGHTRLLEVFTDIKEFDVGVITWIIIGAIAGALGKLIMPGDDPGGIIVTILLGIVGAFVGGFLTSLIGIGSGGFIWTIIVATIGAIVVLAIYRAIVGGGGRTARR